MKTSINGSIRRCASTFFGPNSHLPLITVRLGALLVAALVPHSGQAESPDADQSTRLAGKQAPQNYHLRGVPTRLTTDAATQGNASIQGRYAAWTQWASEGSSESDIYLYDLATGVERRISGPGFQYQATLSNQKLAYTDGSKGDQDDDIMVYDLGTGETVRLDRPGLQWAPQISGHWMVYNDLRHMNNEVYLCDLRTMTESRLTDSPAVQGGPHISGHRIVWTDFETGAGDIILLDLRTGVVTNLTQHPAYDGQSGIDGDTVVFVSRRDGGIPNLFYHRLRSGETVQVTQASGFGVTDPDVSGDFISYFEHDPVSNRFNLHVYSVSRGVSAPLPDLPTCTGCYRAWNGISGNRVIFSDIVDGNQDVYVFTFRFEETH